MSRHRHVQKMNYDDERDYSDEEEYGHSYEDEVAASPSTSQFMFIRQRRNTNNEMVDRHNKLSDFIPEEADDVAEPFDEDGADLFQMDDVRSDMKVSLGPPPGFENAPRTAPQPIATATATTAKPVAYVGSPPNKPAFSISRLEETPQAGRARERAPLPPNITNLRVSEAQVHRSSSKSPSRAPSATPAAVGMTPNSSSHRLNQLATITSTPTTPRRTRKKGKDGEMKETINLVVVGHVDAGKSTLMGHVLCQLGCVDQRTMHKYKQEAARNGKASFAYAWVLDETEEERSRGVTMDIARTSFETNKYKVVLLDAPGHRDFIPNMITGASQADAALLVANATRGEFETGFENGGQTREHAMLLRALGVSQLVVAINKMDTVDWAHDRYKHVESALCAFLCKQAGFSAIRCVPVSGLGGDNLTHRVDSDHPLAKWYNGPCLVEHIDMFAAPQRAVDAPLRCIINDVLKLSTSQLVVSAKVEAGEIEQGEKVFVMPTLDAAVVRGAANDSGLDGGVEGVVVAGEQALLTLNGTFEPDTILPGHIIVRGGKDTLIPGRRFTARIVVFDIRIPIVRGTQAELFCHSLCVPCTVVKLVAVVNKATGEVMKEKPRCVTRQQSCRVEIETEKEVAIEPFTVCRALGRITLRADNKTIAAGIIENKIN